METHLGVESLDSKWFEVKWQLLKCKFLKMEDLKGTNLEQTQNNKKNGVYEHSLRTPNYHVFYHNNVRKNVDSVKIQHLA